MQSTQNGTPSVTVWLNQCIQLFNFEGQTDSCKKEGVYAFSKVFSGAIIRLKRRVVRL